jgi:hypothetical protein
MAQTLRISSTKLEKMSKEDILHEFSCRVYELGLIAEQLEHQRRVRGNGHHFAQHLSAHAVAELKERWNDDEEKKREAKGTMDFVHKQFPDTKKL